jgi:hypothetical protein
LTRIELAASDHNTLDSVSLTTANPQFDLAVGEEDSITYHQSLDQFWMADGYDPLPIGPGNRGQRNLPSSLQDPRDHQRSGPNLRTL